MHNTKQRLELIQSWIKKKNLDAFIIPHDDEFLSEYVPPENERLAWATGFTGSAGMTIVSHKKAAIFVDGRYTVQVKEQVDSKFFDILNIPKDSWSKWIASNHQSGAIIGFDPRMHRIAWKHSFEKQLRENTHLKAVTENPIDFLWMDRPVPNQGTALLLNEKFTGKSSQQKREELGQSIAKNKCDAAFITQLDSIAWLLNIRGNDVPCNPVLLCHGILHNNGNFDLFISKNKIPDGFNAHVGPNVHILEPDDMKNRFSKLSGKIIQLDFNSSNVWSRNLIMDAGADIINKEDPCTLPKACKNKVEIEGMKNCHIRDAIAVCRFLCWFDEEIYAGKLLDEGTLADKLDAFRADMELFKGISFGTISAAGKNAAMCHYNHNNHEAPSNLEMDSVYLVDSGGQYLDGTTDITRTVAVGTPNDFIIKTFTLVLKGHIALSSAQFPDGIAGQHVDTLARQYLWNEGLDFEHGTGHGVGCYLNVHEGPHGIGKGVNKIPFKEGMVVSNEPGYYRENEFGIRSENLIFVKKIKDVEGNKLLGFENLTLVPFDTRLMDMSLLTNIEKKWINNYHQEVLQKISPHVEGSVLDWLKKAVQPI